MSAKLLVITAIKYPTGASVVQNELVFSGRQDADIAYDKIKAEKEHLYIDNIVIKLYG